MSVTTTADEHLQAVKDKLNEAIQQLSSIIVDQCYGYDEFSHAYKQAIRESFQQLIEVRDKLGS